VPAEQANPPCMTTHVLCFFIYLQILLLLGSSASLSHATTTTPTTDAYPKHFVIALSLCHYLLARYVRRHLSR